MCFPCKTLLLGIAVLGFGMASRARADEEKPVLRVAADPNNLPFSNNKGEGFENKLAEMLARDLGAQLQYVWHAQRRGFFRETLKENRSDVVMGVPADFERAATTKPYYTSSYLFVTRKADALKIESIDDARLRTLRVGIQMIGDDYVNTPPAHALASRGIITNVVGYLVFGNYAEPNPPARIIDAVASGEIDVAMVWGPLAGYFAAKSAIPLELRPISSGAGDLPLTFSIAIGCKRKDPELRQKLNAFIEKHRDEIRALLAEYHVPLKTDIKEALN